MAIAQPFIIQRCAKPARHNMAQVNLTAVFKFVDDFANDAAAPVCPVRAFWLGNKEHAVISPSLAAWLRDFVINVENGAYVEEPERGTFLRRGK